MSEIDKAPEICAVATKFTLPPDASPGQLTDQMVQLLMAGARSSGFWSGEMIPPPENSPTREWRLLERFSNREQASGWHHSEERKQLVEALKNNPSSAQIQVFDELTTEGDGEVATAIVTDVRPGMEEEYFEWEAKIQSAQAKFPGYRGLYLQPPGPGRQRLWATLLRFDSPDSLERWFACEERKALLHEAEKFIKRTQIRSVSSSYPGWIPTDAAGNSPPNWKTAMLVLLGLAPVVLLQLRVLLPLLQPLPPVVRTFINLMGSVAATTYVTMPPFIKFFHWWLFPEEGKESSATLTGIAILLALYAVEILAFWY